MRSVLFALLFAVLGSSLSQAQHSAPDPDTRVLFSFDSVDEARWSIVNDGVMGGRSKGYGEIEEGRVRFWGELVTRGGGFTSVRTQASLNLAAYDGVELRVRGGGRTFEVEISDGQRFRGRTISRRAAFKTDGEWTTVRIPFSALRASVFGQPIQAPPLNQSRVRGIGLYILDGIDGPFELEVDEIRVYRDTRTQCPTIALYSQRMPADMASIARAGTDFIMGSPTLKCMATAPTMSTPTTDAAGRTNSGIQKPMRSATAAPIFRVPTIKKAADGRPYALNSSFRFVASPPR